MDRGKLRLVEEVSAGSHPETTTTQDSGQRPHNPEELGSRVFKKEHNGWYYGDFRWRGAGRRALRDPDAPGWPDQGDRTKNKEVAERWAKKYDLLWKQERDEAEQRRTGRYRSMRLAREAFVRHRRAQNADSTWSGSNTAATHLMEFVGEEADPASVTSHEIQRLFDDFLAEGYKASSVTNTRNHLLKFFEFVNVEPNPAAATTVPRVDRADVQPWDEDEQARIRRAADKADADQDVEWGSHRLLVEFLFSVGPRIQEAAAAMWEDIDPKDKVVRIRKQIGRSTNKPQKTKGGEARTTVVLQEWWPVHDSDRSGLIFPAKGGGPIRYRKMYDHVCRVLTLAGLKMPNEAAHKFRHTYAFLFLDRGGSIDHLQKSLGHKRVSTTQEYYDHFTTDHAARAGVEQIYGSQTIRRGPRQPRVEEGE